MAFADFGRSIPVWLPFLVILDRWRLLLSRQQCPKRGILDNLIIKDFFMDKRKRWQAILIIAVMVLTIYNILPTVFFYTKPLKDPIGQAGSPGAARNRRAGQRYG